MRTNPADVECISEVQRAGVLLQPLRLEIVRRAREPQSAASIAGQIGLPRQKVNYHVRQLEEAGFLRRAGRRLKRNLVEQRYQATARSYLLAPQVLGPLRAAPGQAQDRFSAGYLLALTSQAQEDLSRLMEAAQAEDKRLATLSLSASIRFRSPEQRQEFTSALQEAVTDVIGRFTSPDRAPDGSPGEGRPYRLFLGCHPAPPEETDRAPEEAGNDSSGGAGKHEAAGPNPGSQTQSKSSSAKDQ